MDRGGSNKNAILSGLGAGTALTEISKAASELKYDKLREALVKGKVYFAA